MRKIVLGLALFSFGMLAHAFPISVTYEAIITNVFDDAGLYGLAVDDDLTGTFYFDIDDAGSLDEFIRSTHVADTEEGNAIAHLFFGVPDTVSLAGDELIIVNLGGIVDELEDFALLQAEVIFVGFDLGLLAEYGPDSEPVWIDEVLGGGFMFSLPLDEENELAEIGFSVTSLHIGSVPESVPEPTTILLLGLGLAGLGFARRRTLNA